MADAREKTDISNIGDWNVAEISEWVNEVIGGEAGKKAADKFKSKIHTSIGLSWVYFHSSRTDNPLAGWPQTWKTQGI